MLHKQEYLLVKLAEECAEVAQTATKALTFGVNGIQRDQPLTNAALIWQKFADLCAIVNMLQAEYVLPSGYMERIHFREMIEKKQDKVGRYMTLSRERGCLEEERVEV